MSVSFPATPQRSLPGAFSMTPAPAKQAAGNTLPQPSLFRQPSNSKNVGFQKQGQQTLATRPSSGGSPSDSQSLDSVERAARTINEALTSEAKYPELDAHVSR